MHLPISGRAGIPAAVQPVCSLQGHAMRSAAVGIVGGGIMGISIACFLAERGVNVEVFEASGSLGGLAASTVLDDGVEIDRFYHAIMSSDEHLIALCSHLGIENQLRFRETRMGFYYRGTIHSMSNAAEFLRFPPLTWLDRIRLGATVLYAQFLRDWHTLEGINVEDWLVRLGGRRTYEEIWRPMLRAKFDGEFNQTPATYVWSRLVRMKSARAGLGQRERAGHLIGGYMTLLNAMVGRIEALGGRIRLNAPVQEIVIQGGQARGLRLENGLRKYDAVFSTLPVSVYRRLIPGADRAYAARFDDPAYFGIVCPVLVLDRPLSGFWTLNIADDRIPFTGVIETTAYIDPKYVGGHHLVYLPKYTAPGSDLQKIPDDAIRELWLGHLLAMFPSFDRRWIRKFPVFRERFVQPVHRLNAVQQIPAVKTPIANLYLATTAQIYPELASGESVTRFARAAANLLIDERGKI